MNHHFFAASAATWATTDKERDLQALLDLMNAERLAYNLYMVPCSHEEEYEINWYMPQVAGTVHLGTFKFKQKEKQMKKFHVTVERRTMYEVMADTHAEALDTVCWGDGETVDEKTMNMTAEEVEGATE